MKNILSTNRGFVYRSQGTLVLTRHLNDLVFETKPISDSDGIYDTMPDEKAEVVQVDHAENIGMVDLKSLFGLTFSKETDLTTADEAISFALKNSPEALVKVLQE